MGQWLKPPYCRYLCCPPISDFIIKLLVTLSLLFPILSLGFYPDHLLPQISVKIPPWNVLFLYALSDLCKLPILCRCHWKLLLTIDFC